MSDSVDSIDSSLFGVQDLDAEAQLQESQAISSTASSSSVDGNQMISTVGDMMKNQQLWNAFLQSIAQVIIQTSQDQNNTLLANMKEEEAEEEGGS